MRNKEILFYTSMTRKRVEIALRNGRAASLHAIVTETRCDWNGITFDEREVKLSGHHYDTFAARCAINDTYALLYMGHVYHLRTGNRYIRMRVYSEYIPFRRHCFTATCAQKLLTNLSFIRTWSILTNEYVSTCT